MISIKSRILKYIVTFFLGMDLTPGGKDESLVPEAERLGEEVPLEERVKLLTEHMSFVIFSYVS